MDTTAPSNASRRNSPKESPTGMDWSATPSGLTGDHNAPPKRLTRWTPIIAHRRAASANSMQLRIGRAGSQSETGEFFLSRDSFCMGSSDAGVSVGVSDASGDAEIGGGAAGLGRSTASGRPSAARLSASWRKRSAPCRASCSAAGRDEAARRRADASPTGQSVQREKTAPGRRALLNFLLHGPPRRRVCAAVRLVHEFG